MEKVSKVTIRLTPEQAQALDFLVSSGGFKNRSEALRASLEKMTHEVEEEPGEVKVKLPDTMIDAIDMLVSMDHFVSRELGIRELIRNGLTLVDLKEVQARHDLLNEIGAEKKARKIIDEEYSSLLKE